MGTRQHEERKQRITGKINAASERKRSGKITTLFLIQNKIKLINTIVYLFYVRSITHALIFK